MLITIYLMIQDYCFNDILSAPTSVDTDSIDSLGKLGNLQRRATAAVRRASETISTAATSAAGALAAGVRGQVPPTHRHTFFSQDTLRVIPESIQTDRALAGISLAEHSSSSHSIVSIRRGNGDIESGTRSVSIRPSELVGGYAKGGGGSGGAVEDVYSEVRSAMDICIREMADGVEKDAFVSAWG